METTPWQMVSAQLISRLILLGPAHIYTRIHKHKLLKHTHKIATQTDTYRRSLAHHTHPTLFLICPQCLLTYPDGELLEEEDTTPIDIAPAHEVSQSSWQPQQTHMSAQTRQPQHTSQSLPPGLQATSSPARRVAPPPGMASTALKVDDGFSCTPPFRSPLRHTGKGELN